LGENDVWQGTLALMVLKTLESMRPLHGYVVGLYGVIAYSVSQRTREIGVRMALGAQRRTICQLVMKEAACLIGIGLAAGLVGSLAASALVRSLLFGTKAWDVTTLLIVAAILTTLALVASYLPARSAASVNPLYALRAE
jgi:ABC-type antimicrobial peptide transport system permease subunit